MSSGILLEWRLSTRERERERERERVAAVIDQAN